MKRKHMTILFSFVFLLLIPCRDGIAQQAPAERPPVNVAGNWTIHSKSDDGRTATQFIQLKQDGTVLSGHFKGPHQSGGLEGTVDARHIEFRTKTREVLTFRGMVKGESGDSIQGNFGIRGIHGVWEATRTP